LTNKRICWILIPENSADPEDIELVVTGVGMLELKFNMPQKPLRQFNAWGRWPPASLESFYLSS
jgi:hypothetical protein